MTTKLIKTTIALAMLTGMGNTLEAKQYTLLSPNGKLQAILNDKSGLTYTLLCEGDTLVKPSMIGMTLGDGVDLSKVAKLSGGKTTTKKETIDAPFYRQKSFNEEYRQMDLKLGKGYGMIVRAYNEGVAYRFYTTNKGETVVKNETADYAFNKDNKVWLSYSTNYKDPYAMAFQNVYEITSLPALPQGESAADANKEGNNHLRLAFLPATIDCGKAKVTILESDIQSYPSMFLSANNTSTERSTSNSPLTLNSPLSTLNSVFAPYPKKMEYYAWRHMTHVTEREDYIAKSTGARNYPWRIFAVTKSDTEMPVNNLVYALATPNKIGDTSWIKPGKVAWDWWNDWNLKGVDFEAGINFDTYKYYIDFASKHGLQYIVLDEGWYDSKSGDIMHPIDAIKLPELIAYGKQRGVDIVLWAVFNVMDENLETICKHYADMGIKGFKVDFMDRNDQTATEMVERLAICCAKHKLFLDLHGIYTPVGLNRTYPNVLNYESVFGMEESRWTDIETHDMPLYDVTFPYIRMMAGQVDFTPGAMRNANKADWKAVYRKPMSMGTRCHQAACYIVHDTPFTMLADTPTNYEADETYTNYIATLPEVFDETIIPQGEIGKYIVTARKKGNDWYIAGQTNWDERDICLEFPFLEKGVSYKAEILQDGINANHDAEDYKITSETVNSDSHINMHLAQGGGFVMKVKTP